MAENTVRKQLIDLANQLLVSYPIKLDNSTRSTLGYAKAVGLGSGTVSKEKLQNVINQALALGVEVNDDANYEDVLDVYNKISAKAGPKPTNENTMTNLEKYIKKVIKEAKNPLAKKMKEIENRGRKAALETKLAAIEEMIEETQGRLTRIDEDNEFRDMMDKNAVKEVRKQLKELERAKAKLQKEYGKMGNKLPKNYDEDGGKKVMDEDIPVEEDAIDEEAFELNESAKRMQKLANIVKG